MIKLKLTLCLALALLFAAALPASAHKVSVFGYVENGMLLGEGYFPGGGKAKGSRVELLDSAGKVLATTTTDNEGAFKLKLPKAKAPLKLVVIASMGHKGEYVLNAEDLGQGQEKPAKGTSAPTSGSNTTGSDEPQAQAVKLDQDQIQAAVEKALDKKLAPLNAQIAKMQAERGIGIADVIGGMGYILGLLGLAAYLKTRKQR